MKTKTTVKKRSNIDKLFRRSEYSEYQIIKTQLSYFYGERGIGRAQRRLLEKPQWILSRVIPLINNRGGRSSVKVYLVKQGRVEGSFIGGIIYDPEITVERLKALSLSIHLQARLAGIPLEPLVMGIESRKNALTPEAESEVISYLQKTVLSPALNGFSDRSFNFSAGCFSELLLELKEIEFEDENEIKIAASNPDPFTDRVFQLLAGEDFEVSSFGKGSTGRTDVLILSGSSPLAVTEARKVRANVVVERLESSLSPEVRTVLAERRIPVIPNLITTLPRVIEPCFDRPGGDNLRIPNGKELEGEGARITREALRDSWKLSRRESLSLTSAAFALAIERSTKSQSLFLPFRQ